jgi:lipopolysaccharide export system protein LptA
MLVLILLFMISINSYASTLSKLHINSSDLIIDREKLTAVFTGNVVLCFDTMKLLGGEVVFYFEDNKIKDIKEIHVVKNIRAIEADNTILLADKAIFEVASSKLKLTGHVVIEKGDKIMKANEMNYLGKMREVLLRKGLVPD